MSTKDVKGSRVFYDIVGGPNKDVIFDACKYACSKDVKIPLDFKIAISYTAPKDDPERTYIPMRITAFVIQGIQQEDGSGDKLNIHGRCKADIKAYSDLDNTKYKPYRFRAYYNAKTRKGFITFI